MSERDLERVAFESLRDYLSETLFIADARFESFPYVSRPLDRIVTPPLDGIESVADLWTRFIADADRARIQRQILDCCTGGEEIETEFRLVPVGAGDPSRDIWIELRAIPIRGADGSVHTYAGTLVDRTDQRRSTIDAARGHDREIFIGAQIQRSLLLTRPAGDMERLQIAAQTLPSQSIDGDFYDFYQHTAGSSDLVIGDVMGKGISAALTGAAVKNAFMRAMLDETVAGDRPPDLARVVARTEQQIGGRLAEVGRFVTMYVCRVDLDRSYLEYIDCGHTLIIHHSHRTGSIWAFEGSNMPIGFTDTQRFVCHRMPIEPNDLLLLYSDGLTEAQNSSGQFFGEKRIMHYLKSHADGPPEAILARLMYLVFEFSTAQLNDDVTAILMRIGTSSDRATRPPPERAFAVGSQMIAACREYVASELEMLALADEDAGHVLYAVHEAVANVWVHTYARQERPDQTISLSIEARPDCLYVTVTYNGVPYQQATDAEREDEVSVAALHERGYGIQIMRTVMDSLVVAEGLNGRMKLVMSKRLR